MTTRVQSTEQTHIRRASQASCRDAEKYSWADSLRGDEYDHHLGRRYLAGLALFWTVVAFGIYWVTR